MPATPRLNCTFTEPRCTCRGLGLLPRPTKPRPAGVWSLFDLPEAGKPAAGWGRAGEGWCMWQHGCVDLATPTPNPSPAEVGFTRLRPSKMPNSGKPEFGWGGERTEFAARTSHHLRAASGRNSAQILAVCSPSAGTAP